MAWTVGDEIARGAEQLKAAGIASPEVDARALMALALGVARERIILHLRDPLSSEAEFFYPHYLADRIARIPVSRIRGNRDFWGRNFKIDGQVLDPRPETETLIELALSEPFEEVLDIGTGSGCIILTLLSESPTATGIGCDLSEGALRIAQENAVYLGVASRVQFECSNWFEAIGGTFDLIVSNPPYISATEMQGLEPEVVEHDPRMALTDGKDGLTAYRAIADGITKHLAPNGRVLLEIGPTQADDVVTIFKSIAPFTSKVHQDLDGRDRVVELRLADNDA